MHPQMAPEQCPDKHGLTEDLRLAMNFVIELNKREMEAVLAGEFAKLPLIKAELVTARKQKDSLLGSYYQHVRDHGC